MLFNKHEFFIIIVLKGDHLKMSEVKLLSKENKVKNLSEAISAPIIDSYKAGGLGLVFAFLGTLLLLIALFSGKGVYGYIFGILGSLMILAVLCLFYFRDIKKLKDINDSIEKNKELIDNVQEAAIQMTDLAYGLQSLAFKHANEIASMLTLIRQKLKEFRSIPLVSNIPGVDKVCELAENQYVLKAEDLSALIVKTTSAAKSTIEDIKISLVESDPKLLKKYLNQIEEMGHKINELLSN